MNLRVPSQPPVGNLIAYEYLWQSQRHRRDDGGKTYPTVVMAARSVGLADLAFVAGVSHKPPREHERAMEIPPKLKRWLGLDDDRSWIYTDEINVFVWPGPDVRPGSRVSNLPAARRSCLIAALPVTWFKMVTNHLDESRESGLLAIVKRTE